MTRRRPLAGLARHGRSVRSHAVDTIAPVSRQVGDDAVALTFDDGPQPGSTDRVLDVLGELDVRATFFCVGRNAQAHPQLVRRISADGHAVGSHSFTHPDPEFTRTEVLAQDYADGRRAVAAALGEDTRLFRPPRGHLTPTTAVVLRRQGLRTWLWTLDPEDWRPGVTREHITSVAGRAQAGDVVLLHDWIEQPWAVEALDRSATVDALRDIVDRIRTRGLTLRRLDP